MGLTVIIAEKPKMAAAIREGMPSGVFSGQVEVTNAFGHLFENAPPDTYLKDTPVNENGKKPWRYEDLPIIPQKWEVDPKSDAKEQLEKIRLLLQKADLVVNAGDPGREGQYLIDEILMYFGYKGKVKRVLLSSLDKKTVEKAFFDLRDNEDFAPLRDSAIARSQADWLFGMNFSRAVTILSRNLFPIGRVQTPTLALVVRRDMEIEQFVPKNYFLPKVKFSVSGGDFWASWKPSKQTLETVDFDESGRLIQEQKARAIISAAIHKTGIVIQRETQRKKESAPLPFNLSTMQKVASAKFGFSASETLEICQSLYIKKLTTYPRSDCQYLPDEQFEEAPQILAICKQFGIFDDSLSPNPNQKHAAWSTAKMVALNAEHHAIIPTTEPAINLTPEESKIYRLIAQSYVALFLPDAEFDNVLLQVQQDEEIWEARGRREVIRGWRSIYGKKEEGEDSEGEEEAEEILPLCNKGDMAKAIDAKVEAKKTTPPPRFTDGTLIEAMSNIHRFVADEEAKKTLRENAGIGTEATRAAILDGLASRDLFKRQGKKIISTEKGRALITFLSEHMPELVDPVWTAKWEQALEQISKNKISLEKFRSAVEKQVIKMIGDLYQKREIIQRMGGTIVEDCPICAKSGREGKAYQRRSKKGLIFWACNQKNAEGEPLHAPMEDDSGKPGKMWEAKPRNEPEEGDGPVCAYCGKATQRAKTSTEKPYFKCAFCKKAWWPKRENGEELGTEWEARKPDGKKSR